ncbi:hypothetical protein [Roseovarius sp. D0-M9]|uniref:hypothetical protein n=1 Tax=Roseovarius sp. D0-M9 TaxID=3127117 RepID=UPI00300FBAAE
MDLAAAVRSETDKAEIDTLILKLAKVACNVGFIPDWTEEEWADMYNEFRLALRDMPSWAVENAFHDWMRAHPRRPSPAEIVILAERALRPIKDEIAHRKKEAARLEEQEAERRRAKLTPEEADAICARAGYTPKHFEAVKSARMVRDRADLERVAEERARTPHWTETVDPDSPEMEALRKARDENPLVKAARAAAARDVAKKAQ